MIARMTVLGVLGLYALFSLPDPTEAQTYIVGFTVEIAEPGAGSDPSAAWEEVSGGGLTIETSSSSTGTDDTRRTSSGHKYIEDLTLRGPVPAGRRAMSRWLTETLRAQQWERAVGISDITRDGTTGRSTVFLEAFPVRYVFPELSASGAGTLYETLVVKANRVELAGGGSRGVNEREHEILENGAGKFRVDIDDAREASSLVQSLHIDDIVVDARETTRGADWDYRTFGPGTIHYGEMTITARLGPSSELYQWWYDASVGRLVPRNISVMLLKRDGTVGRQFDFFDCTPVRYSATEYSASGTVVTETLTVQIGRVEFVQ